MIWKSTPNNYQIFDFFWKNNWRYTTFERIDAILKSEYIDQAALVSGENKMLTEAVKAYVNGIGDPYTTYLDAEELSGLQSELEGEWQIEGIGAVVSKKDYYIQIEEIIKWSPAFNAELQPLDRIILIGTWETKDLTTSEAVQKIRGPQGIHVELFIERPQTDWKTEYLKKEVIRDIIDIPSVRSDVFHYSGHNIWYLEISIFGDQTNRLVNRAITEFIDKKVEGIIIDLRGNGGGLLTSAVDIAGHFLTPESIVSQTKYHNYQDLNYTSKGFWELKNYPTVVLIDGLSASASEILTLALRDNNNAKVVGSKSFGKGSIQTLQEFSDKTSLKYTVGKRYSPKWISIDKEGIKPDIEVEFNGTGYIEKKIDNQLETAKSTVIELLR